MTEDQIKDMIKGHEGFRDRVYVDTLGNLTVGWGHFLAEGSYVPREVAQIFFDIDYQTAVEDYQKLKLGLDPVRRGVIIDMLFNMAISRLMGFKNMLSAIKRKDFSRAADEMLDSRWARQVKTRAVILANMMRSGR